MHTQQQQHQVKRVLPRPEHQLEFKIKVEKSNRTAFIFKYFSMGDDVVIFRLGKNIICKSCRFQDIKKWIIFYEECAGLLLWNCEPDVSLNTLTVLTGLTPTHSLIHFRSALRFGVERLHRVGKTRRKTRWTHWIHFGNRWLSDFKPDRESK